MVKYLNLETVPHHKPYLLGWITKDANLQVTRKCVFKLAITANFIAELELDVVSLDIYGIVLGSSYLYDQKDVFHRFENKYHLFKDGVEYIVRAHRRKLNSSLASIGQMKRLVNSNKNLVILMIKQKNDTECESFADCDVKLKAELVDVVNQYGCVSRTKGIATKMGNSTRNSAIARLSTPKYPYVSNVNSQKFRN